MNQLVKFSALAVCFAFAGLSQAQVQVVLNGKQIAFPETQPQDIDNHVLVPIREIFEAFGATVNWDPATQTVTASKRGKRVQLQIGATQATVDNQTINLEAPARIMGGSTMIPLRFVSEALGATVDWSDLNQTVTIITREPEVPRSRPIERPIERPAPPRVEEKHLNLSCDHVGLVGRVPMSFTLTGPSGGQATVQVPGVSEEVPMSETRPGVYTVRWQSPPSNIMVENTTAIAHLRVDGQDLLADLRDSLTIDTITPTVERICPSDTGEIHTGRPDIVANLDDGAGPGINPDTVRIRLDHADITNRAHVSNHRIALYPDFELASGPHEVEIEARDLAGNMGRRQWTFIIAPPLPEPCRVVVAPPRAWVPGAIVSFSFDGPRGGDAICDLGARRGITHLKESKPGHYVGSYSLQIGDHFDDDAVIVRLHAGTRQMSFQAQGRVRMSEMPNLAPTITSPIGGRFADSQVVVTGRAAPRTKVLVQVGYATTSGKLHSSGGLANVTAVAGNDGVFRTSPIALRAPGGPGATFSVSATSVGSDGRKSQTTTVQLRSK